MLTDSVLLTDSNLPGTASADTLAAAGLTPITPASDSVADLVAAGSHASALVVQWATVGAELLDQLPNLRFISRLGIGYDMVDVDAATARGIAVANTPTYCTEEVAMHSVAMILSQARGLQHYDGEVRAGSWAAVAARPMAVRPSMTTISVIGFGRIGSLVAAHCKALGFSVVVSDPYLGDERIRAAGFVPATLDEAIAVADILTLHAPLTEDTRHMINAQSLAKMKPTSAIVNTCRGPLIDEDALADALDEGALGGAALDVFETEPLDRGSRLLALPAVQLTPHAAWYSPEALHDLPVHAARNVVEFLQTGSTGSIVNPAYTTALAQRA